MGLQAAYTLIYEFMALHSIFKKLSNLHTHANAMPSTLFIWR